MFLWTSPQWLGSWQAILNWNRKEKFKGIWRNFSSKNLIFHFCFKIKFSGDWRKKSSTFRRSCDWHHSTRFAKVQVTETKSCCLVLSYISQLFSDGIQLERLNHSHAWLRLRTSKGLHGGATDDHPRRCAFVNLRSQDTHSSKSTINCDLRDGCSRNFHIAFLHVGCPRVHFQRKRYSREPLGCLVSGDVNKNLCLRH